MRVLRFLFPDTRDVPAIVMTDLALALFAAGFLTRQAWLDWTGFAVIPVAAVYHTVRVAADLGGFTTPTEEIR